MNLLPAQTLSGVNRIHNVEFFTLCRSLPSQSIDMILCDLPYASLEVGWDKLIPAAPMWEQFKRLITPTGAIVLTAKQPFSSFLVTSNPTMYRYSWYWEKSRGANVAQTAYRPLAVIEEVLVFSHAPAVFSAVPTIEYHPPLEKLDKPYKRAHKAEHQKIVNNSVGSPMRNPERGIGVREYEHATPRSLIYFPDDPERGLHPTQKPVSLFEYLIKTYSNKGDTVLDPTCGVGTTAVAARNTKRNFICGDLSPDYVLIARDRLRLPFEKRHTPQNNDVSGLPLFAVNAA